MYRQRPAYPALIFTICVLIAGGCIIKWQLGREADGLESASSVVLTICISVALAGCGLVAAFARYQYTHLWQKKKHPPKPVEEQERSRGRW